MTQPYIVYTTQQKIRSIHKMRKIIILFILTVTLLPTQAQSRKAVETSTDITMFVPPVAGAIMTLINNDSDGFWQLAGSGATSIATAYALKYSINKQRPDGSDNHSFPSNHTGLAFMGATFIGQRYGWKYSIPAYLISGYTAWGRIHSKRHDFWDVLAGAAIGSGCALLITSPFSHKKRLSIVPLVPNDGGAGFHATLQF